MAQLHGVILVNYPHLNPLREVLLLLKSTYSAKCLTSPINSENTKIIILNFARINRKNIWLTATQMFGFLLLYVTMLWSLSSWTPAIVWIRDKVFHLRGVPGKFRSLKIQEESHEVAFDCFHKQRKRMTIKERVPLNSYLNIILKADKQRMSVICGPEWTFSCHSRS
jgi:hypothetical protein